ncbi:hypothetical protein F4703DRAFT_1867393, partial [Phycomyces blakesleeanus]
MASFISTLHKDLFCVCRVHLYLLPCCTLLHLVVPAFVFCILYFLFCILYFVSVTCRLLPVISLLVSFSFLYLFFYLFIYLPYLSF